MCVCLRLSGSSRKMKRNFVRIKFIGSFVLLLLLAMLRAVNSSPIVNGEVAYEKQEQFPFAVSFGSFEAENSSLFSHFCGGSIIKTDFNTSWAISSAHCFPPYNEMRKEIFAIIGGGDLLARNRKLYSVGRIFMADFDQYSFQNDIALVEINCGHQQVIDLSSIEPFKQSGDCLIYGYGSESFETRTKPSSVLRYGSVQPISYRECEEIMGRVAAPLQHSGQFCARGQHPTFTDACSGDSGSALICRNSSKQYQIVGIISYGMGCGSEFSAGVYQSIFYHRKWIDSTLQSEFRLNENEAGNEEQEEAFN